MYDVTMEELYSKAPGCRVYTNARVTHSYDTLEEVVDYLKESSDMIQREHRLLREWTEEKSNSCIHKILFTRTYGVGRLLRKYVICKHKIAKYDDSLI